MVGWFGDFMGTPSFVMSQRNAWAVVIKHHVQLMHPRESTVMSLVDLLREKVERQMAAYDEQLEAAQAKAKARKAQAEADVAGAELEQQFLTDVNDIKDKIAQGQAYLQELAEASEGRAKEIKARIGSFFD
jgi:DNA anti-recombination protein RmuC